MKFIFVNPLLVVIDLHLDLIGIFVILFMAYAVLLNSGLKDLAHNFTLWDKKVLLHLHVSLLGILLQVNHLFTLGSM
jgi:hypothetical protein